MAENKNEIISLKKLDQNIANKWTTFKEVATFWIVLLCYLTLQVVRAESNGPAKEIKAIGINEDKKSKPEKRDSYRQEGTPSESKNRQQKFSNDEPFRPIFRPAYNAPQRNAPQKFQQYLSQAIVPQAETYYDKPQLMNVERYVATSHNGNVGSSGATPPAHSTAPLIGSYLSSIAGVRYASDAYRGPYSPDVQQLKPQPAAVQKPSPAKVATHNKVKDPTNTSAYVQPVTSFSFDHASKPFHQNDDEQFPQQQQQQRLILRPLNQLQHQHEESQPHFHFYNPHQHQHQHQSLHHTQLNTRAGPQQQQFQYIIALPLSYVRQLQHQLAMGSTGPTLRHEVPLSASKSEYANTAHSVIGPLARDHHGSYQPVHYTSNYQAQHVSPTVQHHSNHQATKPQYTTQYIQIPASALNAALQTAHIYPNRQHEQEPRRTTTSQQSQPQFAYNNYQHQQAQQQQIQNHSPAYVHQAQEKPQTQKKPLQEAIIHVEGAKPSAKSTPTKTYIDNTQIPSMSTVSFKAPATNSIASPETLPIVHYNPIYVQGPPTEQQSLFGSGGGGTLNYHRFATGGFHAPTPLPIIRLSATPLQHFYNSLPQYHPYHQQQQQHQHYHQSQSPSPSLSQTYLPYRMAMEHKTVYGGYTPEEIPSITQGLPYFTHPGGVHYGTHLYHQTPAFVASPSIAAKATETENGSSVGNQHQLEQQQQQQQSLHPHYDASALSASSPTTANGSAASSPLVKYP